MPINRWMGKRIVVHMYRGVLCSHWKEWSTDTCFNMNEPRKHFAKWRKSDTKGTYSVIPFIYLFIFVYVCVWLHLYGTFKIGKSIEIQSGLVVARGKGKGEMGEVAANGCGFYLGQWKCFRTRQKWELHSIMNVLMPLNYPFKMVNSMWCKFFTSVKKFRQKKKKKKIV